MGADLLFPGWLLVILVALAMYKWYIALRLRLVFSVLLILRPPEAPRQWRMTEAIEAVAVFGGSGGQPCL